MKITKSFFKSFTLFLVLFSTFHVQNYLWGMEKKSAHVEFATKLLPSLQQDDFKGAADDCGYFTLYNALQMIQAKSEQDLQKLLLNKFTFEEKTKPWKAALVGKKQAELYADEIETLLSQKDFNASQKPIRDSIVVIQNENLFNIIIKPALDKNQDPKDSLTNILEGKLNTVVEQFCKDSSPFAVILTVKLIKDNHWITYGVRKEGNTIKIYATNSFKKKYPFKTEEEAITATKQQMEKASGQNLTTHETDQLTQDIKKEFEDIKRDTQNLEKQINENADILIDFIEFKMQQAAAIKASPTAEPSRTTSTTSSSTTTQKLPELKLEDLCKAFENKQYKEQTDRNESSPKPTTTYFSQDAITDILNKYYEQATQEFTGVNFESIARENNGNNYSQTLLKKIKVDDGTILLCMGDFHGSVHSLLRNLYAFNLKGYLNDDFVLSDEVRIICTGDYVDRGGWGTEVVAILFYLKLKNPDKVILLRGNHEEVDINKRFGFHSELTAKYKTNFQQIYEHFNKVFATLPYGLWIETPDKKLILCTHGGFDPETFNQVKTQLLGTNNNFVTVKQQNHIKDNKYSWYDFAVINDDKTCIYMMPLPGRGGLFFTTQKVTHNEISAIIRGHQHYSNGFKIFPKSGENFLSDENLYGGPLNWQDNRIKPALETPLSLVSDKFAPIFTLSTATEMQYGPKKSSYAEVIISGTIANCTINPIETSQDLTAQNLNNIIHVVNDLNAKPTTPTAPPTPTPTPSATPVTPPTPQPTPTTPSELTIPGIDSNELSVMIALMKPEKYETIAFGTALNAISKKFSEKNSLTSESELGKKITEFLEKFDPNNQNQQTILNFLNYRLTDKSDSSLQEKITTALKKIPAAEEPEKPTPTEKSKLDELKNITQMINNNNNKELQEKTINPNTRLTQYFTETQTPSAADLQILTDYLKALETVPQKSRDGKLSEQAFKKLSMSFNPLNANKEKISGLKDIIEKQLTQFDARRKEMEGTGIVITPPTPQASQEKFEEQKNLLLRIKSIDAFMHTLQDSSQSENLKKDTDITKHKEYLIKLAQKAEQDKKDLAEKIQTELTNQGLGDFFEATLKHTDVENLINQNNQKEAIAKALVIAKDMETSSTHVKALQEQAAKVELAQKEFYEKYLKKLNAAKSIEDYNKILKEAEDALQDKNYENLKTNTETKKAELQALKAADEAAAAQKKAEEEKRLEEEKKKADADEKKRKADEEAAAQKKADEAAAAQKKAEEEKRLEEEKKRKADEEAAAAKMIENLKKEIADSTLEKLKKTAASGFNTLKTKITNNKNSEEIKQAVNNMLGTIKNNLNWTEWTAFQLGKLDTFLTGLPTEIQGTNFTDASNKVKTAKAEAEAKAAKKAQEKAAQEIITEITQTLKANKPWEEFTADILENLDVKKLITDNKKQDAINKAKELANTAEQQRLEQQRLEQQRLEQQRLEQQRLEQQRLEQQRLEQQRLEQQRLEQQRLEQQRLEQQKLVAAQKKAEEDTEKKRLEKEEVEGTRAGLEKLFEEKEEPMPETLVIPTPEEVELDNVTLQTIEEIKNDLTSALKNIAKPQNAKPYLDQAIANMKSLGMTVPSRDLTSKNIKNLETSIPNEVANLKDRKTKEREDAERRKQEASRRRKAEERRKEEESKAAAERKKELQEKADAEKVERATELSRKAAEARAKAMRLSEEKALEKNRLEIQEIKNDLSSALKNIAKPQNAKPYLDQAIANMKRLGINVESRDLTRENIKKLQEKLDK